MMNEQKPIQQVGSKQSKTLKLFWFEIYKKLMKMHKCM